jgi:hypothetical protein
METGSEKEQAHELIERLEPSQLSTAVRFLEFMLLDPVARALATALPDDEAVTEEDRRRLSEGQVRFAQREGVSMEEVLDDFGLKPEDLALPHKDSK